MEWLVGALVFYFIYSLIALMIIIQNDVDTSYIKWKIDFPNCKKRLLLYIISGGFVQLVVGSSFIYNKTYDVFGFGFEWFKK